MGKERKQRHIYVAMGRYDGAKMYELVELYIHDTSGKQLGK